ncbi:flagellar biosynthesis protein FliP [Gottschalkia acidurici 9a]|uniref:Flagellar biosynthetic protein FliP n=1 Tax=Gottschalkia acidurici (strain ATCC 7906 / DSM 604 / BCRC 14475 / CIP 104303 / KCTC 5404 / NCIMB 10678 / 9a) TaxID=1128398 RepID=K0AZ98_GOTA9|nr:flagellar type III secretion system pore protein FliP [Gottschalkia acidurici]AFS78594.1 flagellar biosynthesis protein FliP [Gottschalkia acidurici 9a]
MKRKINISITITLLLLILIQSIGHAETNIPILGKNISITDTSNPEEYVSSIKLLILFTILTLAPSILIMMTSFTRILIVLSFVRNALGTQQIPQNQILIGLALFLTFFIMAPVATQINEQAIQPYVKEEINQEQMIEKTMEPIRTFMFKQTKEKDMGLFLKIAKIDKVDKIEEIPTKVLIPSFIISEIKTAFQIGFVIFVPFLVIDMVVASTLMSMGMMMLPPAMISLPFKLLLFIMVDGWNLIIGQLVNSFN